MVSLNSRLESNKENEGLVTCAMCAEKSLARFIRSVSDIPAPGYRDALSAYGFYVDGLWSRALPTETKVEGGTSQSKSGSSVNESESGNVLQSTDGKVVVWRGSYAPSPTCPRLDTVTCFQPIVRTVSGRALLGR